MDILNYCMSGKDKSYVFLNELKFEEFIYMSNYKYGYDENVGLLIYYSTPQSLSLLL